MSQFEIALDDYRQRYPRLTVRDKITGTGRRIITEKGPDGVTHKCFIHENRNSIARNRLREKYHLRIGLKLISSRRCSVFKIDPCWQD